MTKRELKKLISTAVESAVEEKLLEVLGDPDEGLVLRKTIRSRLRRQMKAVAAGERGEPLEQVVKQLDLE